MYNDTLLFIVNPIAGKGKSIKVFERLRAQLDEKKVSYAHVFSQAEGHAKEIASAALAKGHRRIIAVGGDGTVRETACALMHTDAALGIIPAGSGNDFVRSLGITGENALETILNGNIAKVDVGMAGGEAFFNAMGFGFDVSVLESLKKVQKAFRGSLAYIIAVLLTVFSPRFRNVTLEFAGQSIKRRVLLVTIGNGTHIGGGMNVTPGAIIDDGLFDVCVISSLARIKIPFLLPKFIKGTHGGLKIVEFFKTNSLSVHCEPGSMLQCDGALLGSTPVEVTLEPKALKVVVPAGFSAAAEV